MVDLDEVEVFYAPVHQRLTGMGSDARGSTVAVVEGEDVLSLHQPFRVRGSAPRAVM